MARSVKCPHCSRVLEIGDEAAGKQLTCAACKKTFAVPPAHGTSVAPPGGKGTSAAAPAKDTAVTSSRKGTSVTSATKGTAVAAAAKDTSVAAARKGTSVAAPAKGTSVAPSGKATSIGGPAKDTSVAAARKGTSVAAPAKGTSVAPSGKGTSVAGPARDTAVAAARKGTSVAAPAKGTAVAAPPPDKEAPIAGNGRPLAPPPVPSAARPWHLHIDGHNQGPYAAANVVDQVKTGRIPPDALAWKEGMADWQPLSELDDFRTEVGTAIHRHSGAAARRHTGTGIHRQKGTATHEDEEEGHRYDPRGETRRETAIALWVCGGLGLVLVVTLLIVFSQKSSQGTSQSARPKPPPQPAIIIQTQDVPKPGPSGPSTTEGKSPHPKSPYGYLSNDQYFGRMAKELDDKFQKALVAHRKGEAKPIYALAKYCTVTAKDMQTRDWAPYKADVEPFVEQLGLAGEGMKKEMDGKADAWYSDGLEEPMRTKQLDLDKVQWIDTWHKHLRKYIENIRNRGMQFSLPPLAETVPPPTPKATGPAPPKDKQPQK